MTRHPNPNCPYHERIPVPPIVDQQIDLIVINAILQPELKNILNMLKTMLESNNPWDNWFEIQLGYFILLHNVELTMAHDAWFVKRNNLKVCFLRAKLLNSSREADLSARENIPTKHLLIPLCKAQPRSSLAFTMLIKGMLPSPTQVGSTRSSGPPSRKNI
jgi:hypothetical protein